MKLSKPMKRILYVFLGVTMFGGIILVLFPVYQPPIKDPLLLKRMEWMGESVIVITPRFTESAYAENGFYNYYDGTCGKECLSIPLKDGRADRWGSYSLRLTQFLKYLGYPEVSDVDLDTKLKTDPHYLDQYGTVILLHSEYVTTPLYQAIINHNHVIYMAPNALYAQIDWDGKTMKLVRGHNYPNFETRNGFGWQDDNSQEEYDLSCNLWQFRDISNGEQLNCSAEAVFPQKPQIVLKMKELIQ